VNYLIDEMNLGTGKSPADVIKPGADEEESDAPRKGKKRYQAAGVTSSTIGRKCKEMRLATHRMGRGFVVIIHSGAQPESVQERIQLLKVRYGLEDLKYDEIKPAQTPYKARVNQPISQPAVETAHEEPDFGQDELL